MILRDTDFDNNIGIEVICNTDDGKVDPENSGMMEIPVYVLWCPTKKMGKGFSRPDWDKLAFVMDSNGEKYTTVLWAYPSIVESGNYDLMMQVFRDVTNSMLSEIENHFCEIGQCKVNPRNCPQNPANSK